MEKKMTDLAQALYAIEHGLLPVSRSGEAPIGEMELSQRMQHYRVPGFSAAFVHNEELVWRRGFGVVQTGSEQPVTVDTIFQAASISKPLTAVPANRSPAGGIPTRNRPRPVCGPRRPTWRG